ncbi:MAG: RNA-binding protein [archaeon]|nr:RNA-binding protein [archaeon]MCP8306203.1 RNA-binding protein [archaeon]
MRIYTLSKRDTRAIINDIAKTWPVNLDFTNFSQVKVIEIDTRKNLLLFPDLGVVKVGDLLLPFLKSTETLSKFPHIEVDLGAVPHICNGADVMRPGIVKSESFRKGDVVVVHESRYKKFIAVGIALVDESDMERMSRGVVVKNKHYIGDRFWEAHKRLVV